MGRSTASFFSPAMALIAASTLAGASAGQESSTPSSSAGAHYEASSDEEVLIRVQTALREDPYFNDAHVTVAMEHGNVILNGFVFSDWDLRDAIRIATKAAAGRRVIDSLTIEVGGRR
jgi:osmotically-inducible protein OsmY